MANSTITAYRTNNDFGPTLNGTEILVADKGAVTGGFSVADLSTFVQGAITFTSTNITDFTEAVQDTMFATLVDTFFIDWVYDDTAGTITPVVDFSLVTLNASQIIGFDEAAQDAVGLLIQNSPDIQAVYDDAADSLTLVLDLSNSSVTELNDVTDAGSGQIITADERTLLLQQKRVLTADETFFVRTTGSDTTGDGSSGNPWATLQFANEELARTVNTGSFNVTIDTGPGSFAGLAAVSVDGQGSVTVKGDSNSTTILTANGTGISSVRMRDLQGSDWVLEDLELRPNSNFGLVVLSNASAVSISNSIRVSDWTRSAFFVNGNSAVLDAGGANIFLDPSNSSTTFAVFEGASNSQTEIRSANLTMSGTGIMFSLGFASLTEGALLDATASTIGGTTPTGPRFRVDSNSVINTSGLGTTHFPGTTAGTEVNGGVYV